MLDEMIAPYKGKDINIFLDLKNIMRSLFKKEVAEGLLAEPIYSNKIINTSIFESIINFLYFHRNYSESRGLNICFYIFFDFGESMYHKNINKEYKANRSIDKLFGSDTGKRAIFNEIIQKNLFLTDSVLNKIKDIYVIKLEHFETDFIPHYLMKYGMIDSNRTNIIYSNDHDLFQSLDVLENICIFTKSNTSKRIIRAGDAIKTYFGYNDGVDDSYFTLACSIMGDPSDYIKGVDGIGKKNAVKAIKKISDANISADYIKKMIVSGDLTFLDDMKEDPLMEKIIKNISLIANNMKMIDFDIISRYFSCDVVLSNTTAILEKKKHVFNVIKNKKCYKKEVLYEALNSFGINFTDILDLVF